METTREIALRTYNAELEKGMISHPVSWYLWKRTFDIAEIEFNKRAQEDFNSIKDLRPFLLKHPDTEMVVNACLHYLGDDAQKWWIDKKKDTQTNEQESPLTDVSVVERKFCPFCKNEVSRMHVNCKNCDAHLMLE